MLKNDAVDRQLEKEKALGTALKFEDIFGEVAGVYPRVMQRSFDLPGWAIVIAALLGASLLGVVGALLAVPTAAAVSMIVKEVWVPRQHLR